MNIMLRRHVKDKSQKKLTFCVTILTFLALTFFVYQYLKKNAYENH